MKKSSLDKLLTSTEDLYVCMYIFIPSYGQYLFGYKYNIHYILFMSSGFPSYLHLVFGDLHFFYNKHQNHCLA